MNACKYRYYDNKRKAIILQEKLLDPIDLFTSFIEENNGIISHKIIKRCEVILRKIQALDLVLEEYSRE